MTETIARFLAIRHVNNHDAFFSVLPIQIGHVARQALHGEWVGLNHCTLFSEAVIESYLDTLGPDEYSTPTGGQWCSILMDSSGKRTVEYKDC